MADTINFKNLQTDIFALTGGLDLVNSPALIKPGRLLSSVNFEPDVGGGGYKKMKGIERFDGGPRPSDADYYVVACTITGTVLLGDLVTGVTSGATGVVILITGTTQMVLTKVNGTFTEEFFNIGGVPQGTMRGALKNSETSPLLDATYRDLAASLYRTDILKVPGSGPVRGVKYFKGKVYAFRDNTGGTACLVYEATAGGWTQLNFGRELAFTARLSTVTVTIATPGVFTWTAHGLANGQVVSLSTTGVLPTGLAAATNYFVVSTAANTFQLSATLGGTGIATSGSQSGTHTATARGLEITEGVTLTGATSGATTVVKRALLQTGTWSSQQQGTVVVDSVTGTFLAGEALQVGGVAYATVTGPSTPIALAPGGKFEFDIINFFGSAGTQRLYCADGVNLLGEFDGTIWVPIRTGATPDTPKFVRGHRKHLLVAIKSSVLSSGTGYPYSWTALTGAAELATGETITGLSSEVGDATTGAMLIPTEDKAFMLYGNDVTDFRLALHSPRSGGKPYTVQSVGISHYLGVRGITQIMATQAFGNFELQSVSSDIQPLIQEKRGKAISSCVIGNTNQYWLFFSDGTGILAQVAPSQNASLSGLPSAVPRLGSYMTFDFGSRVMNTVDSVVDTADIDRIFGAGLDGYVYELNRGTSLDGDSMRFHLMLNFNPSKSLRVRKNYLRTVFQVDAEGYAEFKTGYDLAFGKRGISQSDQINTTLLGRGGFWDSFTWDQFVWDTPTIDEINMYTPGNGDSIAIIVSGDSKLTYPFTLQTCISYFRINRVER